MEEKRILVVDDEESILLAFKKLLQRPFVQVDTCESMEEAIYNIDHFSYDAVIADLRLSGSLGQEGFQIVSYLKKKTPNAKAALITAFGLNCTEALALASGADFYFEKLVSSEDLNCVLKSIGIT
jgi:two-component system response regulator AtoC